MQDENYDLVIVGGGIHGLMIGLQAAESGHRALLLEKDKLAAGATGGWYRILHGGLRYLQSLDMRRFRASLEDSRWFLRSFPDLVSRQAFLMPLYGEGLKRPCVFRAAFLMERSIGPDRNRGVPQEKRIPSGRVLSPAATLDAFPGARSEGLLGGARWEELVVPDSNALIAALAERARAAGLDIREGQEVTGVEFEAEHVTAVRCGAGKIGAVRVILAAGYATQALAESADPTCRARFGFPANAFNLMVKKDIPATSGLSLSVPGDAGGMIFLYPSEGETFLGTGYIPVDCSHPDTEVSEEAIARFLARCNLACPGLDARPEDVTSVSRGMLPAAAPSSLKLLDRDVIHDHGAEGGPRGLVSLSSIKFTTAPSVARRVLRCALAAG